MFAGPSGLVWTQTQAPSTHAVTPAPTCALTASSAPLLPAPLHRRRCALPLPRFPHPFPATWHHRGPPCRRDRSCASVHLANSGKHACCNWHRRQPLGPAGRASCQEDRGPEAHQDEVSWLSCRGLALPPDSSPRMQEAGRGWAWPPAGSAPHLAGKASEEHSGQPRAQRHPHLSAQGCELPQREGRAQGAILRGPGWRWEKEQGLRRSEGTVGAHGARHPAQASPHSGL